MDTVQVEPRIEARNLGYIAWGIMLISFAMFCVLCLSSTVVIYSFFFQSTVPMEAITRNSRGILTFVGSDLSRQFIDGSRVLFNGNTVSPANDPSSQGMITVYDPYLENLFIASATLKGSTASAVLRAASRPRFEWGNASYQIELSDVTGEFEVLINQNLDRDITFDFLTRQGARVKLSASGRYTVSVTDTDVTVINHQGRVVLIPDNQAVGWDIAQGMGARTALEPSSVVPFEGMTNIVQNSYFENVLEPEQFPLVWACNDRNDQINAPRGRLIIAQQDGRHMVQMLRGGGAESNGEVFCQQGVQRGDVWYMLDQVEYLGIRSTFYINYHSLSLCGVKASECPLMIQLDYLDVNGEPAQLNYGFYIYFDPTSNDPNTCESCRQPHIFLKEKTWYTFESGNILQLFPEGERPQAITSIRVYASGHEYDTRVSEVSLLMRYAPENENSGE